MQGRLATVMYRVVKESLIVIILEKRSNFAPNFNFELRVPLNRAVWEL